MDAPRATRTPLRVVSEELLARTPRSTDGTSRVGIDSERLALGAGAGSRAPERRGEVGSENEFRRSESNFREHGAAAFLEPTRPSPG